MPRPKRRYPIAAHPVDPAHLTGEDHTYIVSVVEDVRIGEGYGGQCGFVAEVLAYDFGWTNMGGIYHSPDGKPIGDHVWVCHEPTDMLIDPTADQFGEGPEVRFLLAGSDLRERYLHAETEEQERAWLTEARARRDVEGEYWWVEGGQANPNVLAYEAEVRRWRSGEPQG